MRDRSHISKNMKAVKSTGSKIERRLGKAMWHENLRYRKQYDKLIGKPDFVFVNKKVAIFCDSHFWHGYNWVEKKKDHKSNKRYWIEKIERNIARDKEVNEALSNQGWIVLRFWEHEINNELENCIERVKETLK